MPYKDQHSERCKRSARERGKRYREKNKEKEQQRSKKYREENEESIKEYYKKRQKTSHVYYKNSMIRSWKEQGIIDTDYDLLFDLYIKQTHCWICGKEYLVRKDRQLDHDHDTGEPRYICCRGCNNKLK